MKPLTTITSSQLKTLTPYKLNHFHYNILNSTNTQAKHLYKLSPLPHTLVTSAQQTQGKGRGTHTFYSPKDAGIYMSYIITTTISVAQLTMLSALAVAYAIEQLYGIEVSIKWINDLYIQQKKVAGILIEACQSATHTFYVIGIGLNLYFKAALPQDLQKKVGCLAQFTSQQLDINQCVASIINHLEVLLTCDFHTIYEAYNARFMLRHRTITITVDGIKKTGTVLGVREDGLLIVECNGMINYLTDRGVHIESF